MAKYRKVDPRIWNDEKFRGLSHDGKLVFLFLITHPHMTALGAMRASLPGLASEIEMTPKAFGEAFGEAFAKGMVEHDSQASFIALPRFLKYNSPESPNVVKAWAASLDLIPECALKSKLIQRVKDFTKGLSEGFLEGLPEAFAKGMPYQEQEQEQERERATPSAKTVKRDPATAPRKLTFGEFRSVELTEEEHGKLKAKFNGTLDGLITELDRYSQTQPARFKKYRSHYATLLTWHDLAVKRGDIKPDLNPESLPPDRWL